MRVLLIQQASGQHECLLRIAEPWHRAYCKRHGYEYRVIYGPLQNQRAPVWCKVLTILAELRACEPGTILIWLDADALIEQPIQALADALPTDADVGMVRNRFGELNAGAIWIRASAETLAWLERVQRLGNTPNGTKLEQSRMNVELAGSGLKVAEIPACFNAYKWTREPAVEPAIVRAWHACPLPYRFARMMRSLATLTSYYPL